ncbi:MAG: hypothetical protein CMJ40_09825 [Phycisphaerae bacterium]|nr:hypothetical protein [Phycisphaerae bacterium]
MKKIRLAAGLIMLPITFTASADVSVMFELEYDNPDEPWLSGDAGYVWGAFYGVDAIGDMVGTYETSIGIFYDSDIGSSLIYEGTVVASRTYQDDSNDIWDMSITFDFGGTTEPWSGFSKLILADIVAHDPWDPNDTYSYGLPSFETHGDDGSSWLFDVKNFSETDINLPAPAALALMGLAGLFGNGRRRQ